MTVRSKQEREEALFRPGAVIVRVLLAINHWPIARLAAEARCDPATISQLQLGKRDPMPGMLERLAAAAGRSLPLVEQFADDVIRHRRQRLALGPGRHNSNPATAASVGAEIGSKVAAIVEKAWPGIEALIAADRPPIDFSDFPDDPDDPEIEATPSDDLQQRLADLAPTKRRMPGN